MPYIISAATSMYKFFIVSAIGVLVLADDVTRTEVVQADGTESVGKDYGLIEDFQDEPVWKDPVVYDAYFGKPLTTKRQDFLANVANWNA